MKWDFTGEQVVKGEADYSLEEFREDFYREVKENFPEYDKKALDSIYRLAYDVCYCVATKRDLEELLKHCKKKGIKADIKYLGLIRDSNLENIAMLKAIFARKVSEFMDEGLTSAEALKKLDEYHKSVISGAY
jgi:hypothetical protein